MGGAAPQSRALHRSANPPGQPQAGQWHAIDGYSVIECVVSACGHVNDVPHCLRTDWARARVDVFDMIREARESTRPDAAIQLERGLSGYLMLHDVLLRGPKRGSHGSARFTGELDRRFEAWRRGEREKLITWWAKTASAHASAPPCSALREGGGTLSRGGRRGRAAVAGRAGARALP